MAAAAKEAKKAGPSSEQLQRLMALEGKLLEVAIEESDPDGWMSPEKAEAEAQELERQAFSALEDGNDVLEKILLGEAKTARASWKGQRYWEKKNATATVSLLTKLELYRQRIEEGRQPGKGGSHPDDDKGLKEDIRKAEKAVQGRLALVKKRAV